MPLTETEHKQAIVEEVGDNAAGELAARIDRLWAQQERHADLDRRYLYTKRAAIFFMMGRVRAEVTNSGSGIAVEDSDKFQHLREMYGLVQQEIAELPALVSASPTGASPYASAAIAQTAPIMSDGRGPDPNDRAYRGDVLRRRH